MLDRNLLKEDGDFSTTEPFLYSKATQTRLIQENISPISIMKNADVDKSFERRSSVIH